MIAALTKEALHDWWCRPSIATHAICHAALSCWDRGHSCLTSPSLQCHSPAHSPVLNHSKGLFIPPGLVVSLLHLHYVGGWPSFMLGIWLPTMFHLGSIWSFWLLLGGKRGSAHDWRKWAQVLTSRARPLSPPIAAHARLHHLWVWPEWKIPGGPLTCHTLRSLSSSWGGISWCVGSREEGEIEVGVFLLEEQAGAICLHRFIRLFWWPLPVIFFSPRLFSGLMVGYSYGLLHASCLPSNLSAFSACLVFFHLTSWCPEMQRQGVFNPSYY